VRVIGSNMVVVAFWLFPESQRSVFDLAKK